MNSAKSSIRKSKKTTKLKSNLVQYFKIDVSPSLAMEHTFNLRIWRLMKQAESLRNGLGSNNRWNVVGELKSVDARNAMCLIAMLETPRAPLQNREEERMWQDRLNNVMSPAAIPTTLSKS